MAKMFPAATLSFADEIQKRVNWRKRKAFTLLEILVSIVVLMVIVVVMFSILRQTSDMWLYSNAKLTSFDAATAGFDLMTRQISQATLNTYWGYYDANGNPVTASGTLPPMQFGRVSELHFCLASGTAMLPSSVLSGTATSQAVFFQTPTGYTTSQGSAPDFSPLVGMLNTTGFYVAYTSQTNLPSFLHFAPTQRYRLYEFLEPGEQCRVYSQPAGQQNYQAQDWFTANLGTASRKIADNVIGLILRAQYPNTNDPSGTGYTETYLYDTQDSQTMDPGQTTGMPLTLNQLPTIINATMIVIDEASAVRLGAAYQNIGQPAGAFVNTANYTADLQNWENLLSNFTPKINYHVYTAAITIRDAKWSSN